VDSHDRNKLGLLRPAYRQVQNQAQYLLISLFIRTGRRRDCFIEELPGFSGLGMHARRLPPLRARGMSSHKKALTERLSAALSW
jgi:hypothetical protein